MSSPMPPEPMLTQDDRTWAMAAHLLAIANCFTVFLGGILVLVLWLARRDRSAFVEEAGRESLNFQLTWLIAAAIAFVLKFILIGFVIAAILWVLGFVFPILAALAVSEGRRYRYPFALRLIPSPMPLPPQP